MSQCRRLVTGRRGEKIRTPASPSHRQKNDRPHLLPAARLILRALPAIDLPHAAHLRRSPKRNPYHTPVLTLARPQADCAVIRALARPRARPVHPRVGRAVVRVLALAPSDRSQAARRVDWKTAARAGLPSIGILSRKTDRVQAPLPSYCLNQSRYVAHELLDPCHLPFVLVQGCAADGPLR